MHLFVYRNKELSVPPRRPPGNNAPPNKLFLAFQVLERLGGRLTAQLLEFPGVNLFVFPRVAFDLLRVQLPLCQESNLHVYIHIHTVRISYYYVSDFVGIKRGNQRKEGLLFFLFPFFLLLFSS